MLSTTRVTYLLSFKNSNSNPDLQALGLMSFQYTTQKKAYLRKKNKGQAHARCMEAIYNQRWEHHLVGDVYKFK